jgi:microcystin-dependent protein
MSEPFLAEVRIFSFPFAPRGWAFCNGQTMSVAQYSALFSILGITYGGDGRTTFKLPNLQGGGCPMHTHPAYALGTAGGEEFHKLTIPEMPQHSHQVLASSNNADQSAPTNCYWATTEVNYYTPPPVTKVMAPTALSTIGGQPHENRPPFTAVNFCIALVGIYPSRP